MKTQYIINALDLTGHWIYIKNPVTLSRNMAIMRAREYAKMPGIRQAEIITTVGRLARLFVKKCYLKN